MIGVTLKFGLIPVRLSRFSEGVWKRRIGALVVIPAKAGIQSFQAVLDPGFRRGDAVDQRDFP